MEGERTTHDAIDAFMQTELAELVVRPGSEMIVAQQIELFIRTLSVEQWRAEPEFLNPEVSYFIEDEINAGRLQGMGDISPRADNYPTVEEYEHYNAAFVAIYGLAETHLNSREIPAEIEQPLEHEEALEKEGSSVQTIPIADRLHSLLNTVKDFVRGHEVETPERREELGR